MKLSISVTDEDVDFIDHYGGQHGIHSRSGVVQRAVALLRASELSDDYASAWEEWTGGDDAALWDGTVGDGLSAARQS